MKEIKNNIIKRIRIIKKRELAIKSRVIDS